MATLAIVNPRRKRRRKSKRRSRKHHNPIFAVKRRRRRRGMSRAARKFGRRRRRMGGFMSPSLSIRGVTGAVMPTLRAAFPAAVGAVALDAVWAHLPLPAIVRGGYVQYVAKVGGAVLLGALAGKFLGRDVGSKIALGGVTIVLYNLTRQLVGSFLPGVALAGDSDFPGMGYYGSAPQVGEYNVAALPDYYGQNYGMTGNFAGVGEYLNGSGSGDS